MPIVNFFFLTVVQNSVINSYRSLYSLPGSTSTFLLLLLLSASTLIVKTFEDGDGDSLKVNEKCVKNDDTKKNNNTVVKLKLLLQYVVSEIAKSSLKVLVSNKDTNNVRAPKKVSSSLLAARCRLYTCYEAMKLRKLIWFAFLKKDPLLGVPMSSASHEIRY